MKRRMRLTEGDLHRIVRKSMYRVLNEGIEDNLDANDILALARIVVKKYGDGNMIDFDEPSEIVWNVQHIMRTEGCDEYEALVYMSGHKGGGWG